MCVVSQNKNTEKQESPGNFYRVSLFLSKKRGRPTASASFFSFRSNYRLLDLNLDCLGFCSFGFLERQFKHAVCILRINMLAGYIFRKLERSAK